ncbi:toxin-antitoxin system YwqK family antitoxin [Plebeiibacterium marinum]|uniref:Toxin-antitoxin system YwqK family antitoxin n=1 Tax=Plebeiibacterium marinum TaxID=2992111 RepID=A0AAE3MHJ8_9BACT|nr:toxin-antitoxin system YwqK family antitoxin [Plebeiobacterium marinum]MCW3807866.1 toxin-antitoxin system YwqK family antitoxin [Plebeiobacterium marinum]
MPFSYKYLIIIFFSLYSTHAYSHLFYPVYQENQTINYTDSNGLKQGPWEYYHATKEIKEKGTYKNNLKDGVWTCYYESGTKNSEITYKNGEPAGPATFYYKNGKIREQGNWQIDHWVGNYQYFYENGQISYKWNYNQDGKREGAQLYFHKNGEKMYSGTWNDGKTEGKLLVYNQQGELTEEKTFAKGKICKTATIKPSAIPSPLDSLNKLPEQEDTPRLKFEGTGNHTIIGSNGKVSAKGFFVKGLLFNGEKFNYDKTDKLSSITYYRNGKKTETKNKNH